ncbi:hypothetical protein D1872_81210 [compost metagenome]
MGVFSGKNRSRRGFDAAKQEIDRREKAYESKKGKLFRFHLKDGDEDVPFRFLTPEPITFYEHTFYENGSTTNVTCTEDDECEHCAEGHKATYRGAWLGVDGREFETNEYKDGKKTGKRTMVKDRLKLLVRGQTDIAKLANKHKKFGLTNYPWFVTKTGKGQSTSYEFERADEKDKLTKKQIENLISQLPDKYRELYDGTEDSLYEIVEAQIFGLESDEDEQKSKGATRGKGVRFSKGRDHDDEEDYEEEDLDDGVIGLDDDEEEEEEERPKRRFKSPAKKSTPAAKKGLKKPAAKSPSKPSKKGLKKGTPKSKDPFGDNRPIDISADDLPF